VHGWCEGWTAEEELDSQDQCLTVEQCAQGEGKLVGRKAGPHIFAIMDRTFELTELTGMFRKDSNIPETPIDTVFIHTIQNLVMTCSSREFLT
jgi:hypothetical protein